MQSGKCLSNDYNPVGHNFKKKKKKETVCMTNCAICLVPGSALKGPGPRPLGQSVMPRQAEPVVAAIGKQYN
jgi:hypothetical protein